MLVRSPALAAKQPIAIAHVISFRASPSAQFHLLLVRLVSEKDKIGTGKKKTRLFAAFPIPFSEALPIFLIASTFLYFILFCLH